MTWFEIYAVLSPLLVVVVALITLRLARWQDDREDRRRGQQAR